MEMVLDISDRAAQMMEARTACYQFISTLTLESRVFTAHPNSLHLLVIIQRIRSNLNGLSHSREENKCLMPQLFLDVEKKERIEII